ncbi:hypothetical protein [Mycolicibacterium senegalense]|uniref:hypothetical protein n=1 Tax=Mycolicibacterium senegalense TaxID=1796 RepID=UPI00069C5007|nr:hypothetical protein [Mycolicibacterium senegalense]
MSELQPPPKRKMSRLAKVGIGIVVAFVALVIIGSLAPKPPADEQPAAAPTSSSTPEPTTAAPTEPIENSEPSSAPTPAPAAPSTPQPPTPPNGVTARVGSGPAGDVVVTEFDIHDSLTKGMIASGARRDTVDILKWADEAYPQATEVTVQGRFPMKDAYGNTSNMTILDVTYSRATLDKINFDGIDSDKIWDIRDYGTVHSELQ